MTAAVIGQCEAMAQGGEVAAVLADVGGIYHAAGAGETTWHGFAAEAVQQLREKEPEARFAEIEAITTAEYPTPAKRPLNSRLDCSKLAQTLDWRMPDWRESLAQVIAAQPVV